MKIETKYNIDDTVYFIHAGQIQELKVAVVKFSTMVNKNGSSVYYALNRYTDQAYESDLYPTKEEAGKAWLESQGLDCGLHNV